ncbi:CsbD family protein [Micromonospora globispora]|uniref:CsbD family protein n=1 Tax=Micromonospora globispora TaxID=1450148 RepID=A0A317K9U4_9ACTN|nr:CsbD family protein [Micromonospora globispora]PWU50253.1 CsbD family protein [Micromonospora globispora]PWU58506.1 CsbD family protein [Micromonospora globispora]RQW88712.1 CsbD family protein [Micromonospora globispora]
MSFTEKAKNKAQELTGAAKERMGDVTDNERMRAEGASQQSTARARQTGGRQPGQDVRASFRK